MAFIKGLTNCNKIFVLIPLLMTLTCGCTIGRIYKGSEIKHDPNEKIKIGSTTKGEVLEIFEPPLRIQKQFDGDVFVYAFLQRNSSVFTIEEPYFTNFTIFQYTREQQKMDGLVILFDKNGVVKNFGFKRGTEELTIY
jgi:outer membrane protein assembly factor BamE (lipoprotein component of BamABCDE complex)